MKTIIAAVAVLASATPAIGQSMHQSQDGPRIELRSGWDNQVATVTFNDGTQSVNESDGFSGVVYGGEVGYDATVAPGTLLGVYAGIEGSTAKSCAAGFGNVEQCTEIGRNLAVGVRGGFQIGRSVLGYIKGGYSNGRVIGTYTDPDFPADNERVGTNLDGFHIGTGLQAAFGPNFYGKVEYLYTDYNGTEDTFDGVKTSLDLSRHQVMAGLGVHF